MSDEISPGYFANCNLQYLIQQSISKLLISFVFKQVSEDINYKKYKINLDVYKKMKLISIWMVMQEDLFMKYCLQQIIIQSL